MKSHIQAVRYQIVPHSRWSIREPTCPLHLLNLFFDIFKSFPVFIMSIADLCVNLPLSAFYIIFPTFFRGGISPDFSWIFIDWVSTGFFLGGFSPWPKKKRDSEKSPQKIFPETQSKISEHIVFQKKMQFFQLL